MDGLDVLVQIRWSLVSLPACLTFVSGNAMVNRIHVFLEGALLQEGLVALLTLVPRDLEVDGIHMHLEAALGTKGSSTGFALELRHSLQVS